MSGILCVKRNAAHINPRARCSALEVGVIRGEVLPVWVCAQPMTAAIQPGRLLGNRDAHTGMTRERMNSLATGDGKFGLK